MLRYSIEQVLKGIQKYFTVLVLLVMPVRYAFIFTNLLLLAGIGSIKRDVFEDNVCCVNRLGKLVNERVKPEALDLPKYMVGKFWTENYLSSTRLGPEKDLTLKEAIANDHSLYENLTDIVDKMIEPLPLLLKLKLRVLRKESPNSININNNVMMMLTKLN